jgi:hypothetical protein
MAQAKLSKSSHSWLDAHDCRVDSVTYRHGGRLFADVGSNWVAQEGGY